MITKTIKQRSGYSFLLEETDSRDVFCPEDFTQEHRQFVQTTGDFLRTEFEPIREQLEKLDRDLLRGTLRKAGDAGLLMIEIPEEYGGLGLDLVSQMVVAERMGAAGGFAVAHGVQTGIGSEPILFFGTPEQKQRFLPGLAMGEIIGAYGLTEPGSGSDALAARTTAVLSPDKSEYILNGSKMFISNGGIADLFTIFGKVDGEHFTAFLVERGTQGFTIGAEEAKLGIKSSSTTTLTLQDVHIPVNNLLGEVGKGHKIALNILNLGRLRLGVGLSGAMKQAIKRSITYGLQRKQFGNRLVDFPLIQQKLARMIAFTYTSESAAYRTTGDISSVIEASSVDSPPTLDNQLATLEEFSGECAMNKVYASECLDYVVDETVQIHGGYGFCEEYRVEAAYRDARISRIYEGTNEVNRLFISGNLYRRALNGRVPLVPAVQKVQMAALEPMKVALEDGGLLQEVAEALCLVKQIFLFAGGLVAQKFLADSEGLAKEQEALAGLSDMIIQIYALDSAYLRALKRIEVHDPITQCHCDVVRFHASYACEVIEGHARYLIDAFFTDDTRKTHLSVLRKFAKWPHVNRVELGRKIARASIEAERYLFEVVP